MMNNILPDFFGIQKEKTPEELAEEEKERKEERQQTLALIKESYAKKYEAFKSSHATKEELEFIHQHLAPTEYEGRKIKPVLSFEGLYVPFYTVIKEHIRDSIYKETKSLQYILIDDVMLYELKERASKLIEQDTVNQMLEESALYTGRITLDDIIKIKEEIREEYATNNQP